jgi:hypothetical protein
VVSHKLPSNKKEASRIIRRSKNYVLVGNNCTEEPRHQEYFLSVPQEKKKKKS